LVHCLYHRADLDGICSGAIVRKHEKTVQFHGVDYGDSQFPREVRKRNRVYLVDFTLEPIERMAELVEDVGKWNVIWLDHHDSAIECARKIDLCGIRGTQEPGRGACELTWQYLSDKPMPEVVRLISLYDMGDFGSDPKILPLQYALRARGLHPEDDIWKRILGDDGASYAATQDLVRQGEAIQNFIRTEDDRYLSECGFETCFEGFNALVLNRMAPPRAFRGLFNPVVHDLMISFVRKNSVWKVSLYSNKAGVDCHDLARKHGGGGRQNAAGFFCRRLPFQI